MTEPAYPPANPDELTPDEYADLVDTIAEWLAHYNSNLGDVTADQDHTHRQTAAVDLLATIGIDNPEDPDVDSVTLLEALGLEPEADQ